MERRTFLKVGAAVGVTSLAASSCGISQPRGSLESVQFYVSQLYESLPDSVKRQACVPYDHPLRQYHNRGVFTGGIRIGKASLSKAQREGIKRLLFAGLSQRGGDVIPNQFFLGWRGLNGLNLLIAGDPRTPRFQVILSGPHLNLRLGGRSTEGVAFGGPQVYGDQRGNYKIGLPGNVYQYQLLRAQELFESLDEGQKRRALLDQAPIQTQIELQGDRGHFSGVPVRMLSAENRQQTTALIDDILSVYDAADAAYAWRCIDHNGGVDALRLSYYREGEVRGSGLYQIFRLEGPAAVFYFRGSPHVHAFLNIGMNANQPLSVGEELGNNPTPLAGDGVKRLFERAMKDTCQTDFGFYDRESVVGRLRTGLIRTGDIYNLESWINGVAVVTIKGSRLKGTLRAELTRQGIALEPEKSYAIATTDYQAEEHMKKSFGRGRARNQGVLLREATIDYLKKYGFTAQRPG